MRRNPAGRHKTNARPFAKGRAGALVLAVLSCGALQNAGLAQVQQRRDDQAVDARPAEGAARTVWDGVYTVAQAQRGQANYRKSCSYCHGTDLSGTDDPGAPPLRGFNFFFRWKGHSIAEMLDMIGKEMPANRPGSLERDVLVDIISFMLHVNGIPPGERELSVDAGELEQIMVTEAASTRP